MEKEETRSIKNTIWEVSFKNNYSFERNTHDAIPQRESFGIFQMSHLLKFEKGISTWSSEILFRISRVNPYINSSYAKIYKVKTSRKK